MHSLSRLLVLLFVPLAAVSADTPKSDDKPKRNATVERVKLTGVGALLDLQAIRKDLGMSKEQEDKLTAERDGLGKGIKAIQTAMRGKPNTDLADTLSIMDQIADLAAAYDVAVVKICTAEQVYRLKQLHLQREGPTALLGRFALRELALNPQQEDKLSDAFKSLLKPKLFDHYFTLAAANSEDPQYAKVIQKLVGVLDSAREDAMKVLTADQKAKWKEMTGAEVATTLLVTASADSFLFRVTMDQK